MKSPFAVFRKNQKKLMVWLTGLALFAFVVLDSLMQNMAAFPPILGAMLGLGLAWWVAGKSKYVWVMLLIGMGAGWLLGANLVSTTTTQAAVSTSFGDIKVDDLQFAIDRRGKVNEFLQRAFYKANEGEENPMTFRLQQMMFGGGGPGEQEALMHLIMMQEAEDLDVKISDEQVTGYISEVTDNKLSRDGYVESLRNTGISESQLFEFMKEEIAGRQVRQLLAPTHLASPETYWDAYKKLNMREELAVASIAVEPFVDMVPEPKEEELKALFEEYKSQFPGQTEPGAPGFRQPGKIRLAYLEIDYSAVEKTIPEITEEEIKAYYEENKEDYRNRANMSFPDQSGATNPEGNPFLPEMESSEESAPSGPALSVPGNPEMPAQPDAPAETEEKSAPTEEKPAGTPESKPEEKPTPPAESGSETEPSTENPETPSETEPATEEQPAAEESQSFMTDGPLGASFASILDEPSTQNPETPAEETPEQTPPAQPETATETESSENPPAETPADEKPAPAAEPPAGEEKMEAPAENQPENPTTETASEESPETPPAPEEPLPEYKPLDDNLKEQIRQELKTRKTLAKMDKMASDARGKMFGLNARYATAETVEEKSDIAKQIQAEAKKYAKENSMRYAETPPLSPQELEDSEDHPIGSSTEPAANPMDRSSSRSVIEQHFGLGDAESISRQKYLLFNAEDPRTLNRFIHWSTDYIPAHTAEWDEEGVQEAVKTAWKNQEAQKLAEKRATELAETLRNTDKTWKEALTDVTETGKEGSTKIRPIFTPPFTWLSRSSAPQTNPLSPPPMELTQIPAIFGGINQQFMETVFNELDEGEIGQAWSADRRFIHVVRVDKRTDVEEVRTSFLGPQANLFSFFSPYERLASADARPLIRQWNDRLYEKYNVKWIEQDE